MARLHLDDTQWTGHGSTYARGQAWDSTGRLLRALDLAAMFDALPLASDWPKAAAELNGTYAAARQVGNDVRAVVDRIRSIPLFFRNTSSGLEVTDVADRIVNIPESRLNELSCLEFHLTGYTTGCQTLFDDISQVPAGRALITTHPNENRFALIQYYSFEHGRFLTASENEAFDRLDQLHSQVFGRLVRDLQDRPIILPLSGGYDSRLIAIMLREFAARDVRCFCYGAPGNWEIETSRALAEHLGFCWTYVPYGPAIWRRCHEMPAFRDYFRIAGNFSSVPHIQDWPATLTLAERGLLPHDAVFVPGHTGDFLTGNHIPKRFLGRQSIPTEEVVEAVLGAHYCLWNWPDDPSGTLRSSLAARVREVMGPRSFSDLETAASSFERWEWQERQAKFIVNSVRAYENFGHEWRLPWWDAELMDFWSRISVERRGRRRLFLDYMDRRHRLPVPQANADYSATASTAIRLLEHFGLKPGALAMRRLVRNARWRSVYSTDPMGWFALVDIDTFRRRYTGREIGHAFFADMYIDMVRSR